MVESDLRMLVKDFNARFDELSSIKKRIQALIMQKFASEAVGHNGHVF